MLDTTSDDKDLPRCVTKKWVKVYDQSERNYDVNKTNRIKTPMLRSDFVVKGDITVTKPENARRNKSVAFKNNASFINCISSDEQGLQISKLK